jgi:protein TonB
MRLMLSLLTAIAVHGALFGVAAIVLSHGPLHDVVPGPVEVEVVAPRPDPVADRSAASLASAPSRNPEPAPARPRVLRRSRTVASVGNPESTPVPADPSTASDAPTVSTAGPSPAPVTATVASLRAPEPAAQGGGSAVSAKPRYRTNPTPDYPIPSKRRREEGIVLLNVQVAADGTPAAVSLNRSCGHPLLDRAALDAVRRWTFEPACAAGVPISSLVVVPVRFSLADQP